MGAAILKLPFWGVFGGRGGPKSCNWSLKLEARSLWSTYQASRGESAVDIEQANGVLERTLLERRVSRRGGSHFLFSLQISRYLL